MAKSDYVTRRVTESREVDVFEVTQGEQSQLRLLGTITISGKANYKDLAEQYGVQKVLTQTRKTNTAIYGVPVAKYMEIAEKLTTNTTEEENNGNY